MKNNHNIAFRFIICVFNTISTVFLSYNFRQISLNPVPKFPNQNSLFLARDWLYFDFKQQCTAFINFIPTIKYRLLSLYFLGIFCNRNYLYTLGQPIAIYDKNQPKQQHHFTEQWFYLYHGLIYKSR